MNEISSYEEYRNHKNDENCEIKGFARYGCYKGLDFFEELNGNEKLREITKVEAFEDCLVFIKTHIIELEEENSQLKQERDKYKSIVDEATKYNDYLKEHCKYRLNEGHLRKMKKILEDKNEEN